MNTEQYYLNFRGFFKFS